ncbi:MAG: DUF4082 domain-containing protein [Nibricoccus sp.]
MKTMTFVRAVSLRIIAGLVGVFIPGLLAAALPTPTQPVLVVQENGAADRFQFFVPELLTTEGINGFQTAQLSELTGSFLASYDTVILPHLALSGAQATLFQNYVNSGGTLIGLRADAQLAVVFGVTSLNATLPEAWLQINTGTPQTFGLVRQTLRFHGTADRYALNGASALATLYETTSTATTSPAVATHVFGAGRAILFSFDLTESIVLLRQGNPAWAGAPNNHDGFLTLRASQMFKDNVTNTSWNDLGDQALNDVPQADVQLRLLSNSIAVASAAKQKPLPRFWYFPNKARALLLLTGDQHGESEANSAAVTSAVEAAGGGYTNFLWYPFGSVSDSTVTNWLAAGHALGIHFDDTGEGGGNGSGATWAGMQAVLTQAMAAFATAYPNAPAPVTTRNHFLIWLSNNAAGAPDPIAQARLFQQAGIKFDTSFSAFPNRWGYMNGSGLPLKFLDPTSGEIVHVYEQATQYEDDVQLSSAGYSTNWSLATAQTHYERSLSESLTKYNTAVTMLFHPDAWGSYQPHGSFVLQYAQSHGIPMPSLAKWLAFWEGRAATGVSNFTTGSNIVSFDTTASPAGLTLLIPAVAGPSAVSHVVVDGASQSFTVEVYQGIRYASLTLAAGNHSVAVSYAPSDATALVFGSVTPLAGTSGTTVRIQGGTIDQTVSLNDNGSYVAGPLPAGTYTVTPAAANRTFTPAARTITVGSGDVGDVNFTSSAVAGSTETLFTDQTPVLTNISDGPTTNYELGTVFSSAVEGRIQAIRFWKTGNESGTHVGNIWSATGQLLASVTFTNETASGWQQQALATPLLITAGTSYVVSVNTGNSYYVATLQGLASQIVNGDLRSVVGNNGVFGPAGAFPTSSFNAANYFRDVVFSPGPPPPVGESIFTTQTPALIDQSDGPTTNYELGTTFYSGVAGTISAIRFWKSPAETGAHIGRIWSADGQLLASVTFTNETASGWQEQALATPLAINAAASYVVTVNTGNTYYVATELGLAAQVGNGNLRAAAGNNGVFGPVGAFPTNSYQSTNYFRDVVFVPGATPPPSAGETLFTTQMPALLDLSDGASADYELGTVFSSAVAGEVSALRFWKSGNETGQHVGRLWTASGQLLASVTFANETASGWQQQALGTPLAITANTDYVVTVNTGGTYYVATEQGLASEVANQNLRTTVGNNGVYGPVGLFPTNSYQATNYFRDVVFNPGTASPPPPPAGVSIFTTQTPAATNLSDGASVNYELGTAFASSAAGRVTALRFWKAANESGTHVGRLWSTGGQLLASVTFANETASGWQEQALDAPVAVVANTGYVVSVNTGNTYYVATNNALTSPVTNQDLSTLVGNNGLFGPMGSLPTNSYQSTNYFRDVVFVRD